MLSNEKQKQFARLAVEIGVNLQKGQILIINSPIECGEFARIIGETALKPEPKTFSSIGRTKSFPKSDTNTPIRKRLWTFPNGWSRKNFTA